MRIEKETLSHEEYVLYFSEKRIPLKAITTFCTPIILVLLIVFTANSMITAGQEGVMSAAWVCNEGVYDVASQTHFTCEPNMINGKLDWKCNNTPSATNYSWYEGKGLNIS